MGAFEGVRLVGIKIKEASSFFPSVPRPISESRKAKSCNAESEALGPPSSPDHTLERGDKPTSEGLLIAGVIHYRWQVKSGVLTPISITTWTGSS